ncbi:hypothetical protein GCM10010411_76320 [Actinomadura fulvescens]|uniref:Uncharacterized protein n=1 Tax=Actinomadura fulvescens TaxID=46160 RepID=A0ABN3QJ34_9ACTN
MDVSPNGIAEGKVYGYTPRAWPNARLTVRVLNFHPDHEGNEFGIAEVVCLTTAPGIGMQPGKTYNVGAVGCLYPLERAGTETSNASESQTRKPKKRSARPKRTNPKRTTASTPGSESMTLF